MSSIINASDKPTSYNTRNVNLKFVDNLADYQVHHDDVDIREYDVRLASGERIGEVEGLLADVPAKMVRYAEIEVEDDVINKHTLNRYTEEDRHVLIPIGLIQVNQDKTVTVRGIGLEHMVDYPRFNRSAGYTTSYEIDTNNYLADFHDYGSSYDRATFDNATYRERDRFDDAFYASKFYVGK